MLIYIYIKIQLFFTSAVLWDMGPFFSVSGTDAKYMFKLWSDRYNKMDVNLKASSFLGFHLYLEPIQSSS